MPVERVTACHGVGREPGDGRGLLHSSYLFVLTRFLSHAFLSPVSRVLMTFYTKTSGFAADAAAPLAIVMSPVSRAFKFRSLTRASCPTNSNLAQQSLGYMCYYATGVLLKLMVLFFTRAWNKSQAMRFLESPWCQYVSFFEKKFCDLCNGLKCNK